MDRLPRELVSAILEQCVLNSSKNEVLPLRLVCRTFEHHLKPHVCRTLHLDFARLSRRARSRLPSLDALQTVGIDCKCLFLDMTVVRQDEDLEMLENLFPRSIQMKSACIRLRSRFTMNENTCSETDYYDRLEAIFFNCRNVDTLHVVLPYQIVGTHTDAATMMLANTFKAVAQRPEEDSADLKTLIIDHMTHRAMTRLWMNPVDVGNIMKSLKVVEHFLISLRSTDDYSFDQHRLFGNSLWGLISIPAELKSLYIQGVDMENRPPMGIRICRPSELDFTDWYVKRLPQPQLLHPYLTSLELKCIDITVSTLAEATENFSALEELYISEVGLKVLHRPHSPAGEQPLNQELWVGIPNQRPETAFSWMATEVRKAWPRLRVCRASYLYYNVYLWEDGDGTQSVPEYDVVDPCGLSRSLGRRFVEVATGVEQPKTMNGETIMYFTADPEDDGLMRDLRPRQGKPKAVEYDAYAYQTDVDNTTSKWLNNLDGVFQTDRHKTIREIHEISELVHQGMNRGHRSRSLDALDAFPTVTLV